MNGKISTVMLVLKQPLYAVIAIVTSIGLGLLYYYSSISIVQISDAVEMLGPAYLVASFGLAFIVAILAGVNVSLVVFKIKGSTLFNLKKIFRLFCIWQYVNCFYTWMSCLHNTSYDSFGWSWRTSNISSTRFRI